MIVHHPITKTTVVEEMYSEKDGVPVIYVCTSALDNEAIAMDIFYRGTPHPTFGNRYFGLFYDPIRESLMITNADRIEDTVFNMIEDSEGNLHYSAHRHDYKVVEDKMIDGGRAYVRTNTITTKYKVVGGEFIEA